MERGQQRGWGGEVVYSNGGENQRETGKGGERDRVSYLGRGETPPPSSPFTSHSRKGFSSVGVGGSGRAPPLCIQALQEQRTDIRPKNTQPQPHQLAVETMRASHCSCSRLCTITLCLERWAPHVCVHVLGYLLFFHHQPRNLQPLKAFERNFLGQHLPQHLATEQTASIQNGLLWPLRS